MIRWETKRPPTIALEIWIPAIVGYDCRRWSNERPSMLESLQLAWPSSVIGCGFRLTGLTATKILPPYRPLGCIRGKSG